MEVKREEEKRVHLRHPTMPEHYQIAKELGTEVLKRAERAKRGFSDMLLIDPVMIAVFLMIALKTGIMVFYILAVAAILGAAVQLVLGIKRKREECRVVKDFQERYYYITEEIKAEFGGELKELCFLTPKNTVFRIVLDEPLHLVPFPGGGELFEEKED